MSDIAIKIEGLSKQYRLGQVGTGTISHDLNRWWHKVRGKEDPYLKIGETNDRATKGESEYVWALKDINFEVKKGEVLGIIGKNGAGKSTLLKLLSKVTAPTEGFIKANGRIASLLEVGTGFHPEMTGRENIYMNGTIMGMTRPEISSKLDEIVDFAGIERYLDTPAKRYSSGMTVRLGFAIAAHLEPEILIVDEVLAVGDAEFQKKAIGKMKDVSEGQGRTVLFVSHNMASIKNLCNKGLLLNNGEVSFNGNIDDTIDKYLKVNNKKTTGIFKQKNDIDKSDFTEISIMDTNSRIRDNFFSTESIIIKIEYFLIDEIKSARLILQVLTKDEVVAFASAYNIEKNDTGKHTVFANIPPFIFNDKEYFIKLHIGQPGINFIISPQTYVSFKIDSSGHHGSIYNEVWPGILAPKINWFKD